MNLIKVLLAVVIFYSHLFCLTGGGEEKLAGIWEGKLSIQGMQLRLVFNLEVKDGKLTGTLDSPDQGAKGIPLGEIMVKEDSVTIQVPSVGGYFNGALSTDSIITGNWYQGGMSLPLELKKTDKVEEVKRPQTPSEPFPYNVEEITFPNKEENINLAGTLTIPKKPGIYPVAIMVTGSGPQDRDETIMNHKPFWVIADHLSRNGIAVLRYDDRGTGKSEGDFRNSTTADFADDAEAAAEYLRGREEFKNSRIGIIGHSEGGLIAPLVSLNNENVDFIVLLAGPALTGEQILRLQSRLIAKAEGEEDSVINRDLRFSDSIYEVLKSEQDTSAAAEKISALFRKYHASLTEDEKQKAGNVDLLLAQNLKMLNSDWFRYFLTYDPRPTLEKVSDPVLALYGEKDLQVPAKENIAVMEAALKNNGNESTKVMEMPRLNHLFQKANTGSPTEYMTIEETFSPEALSVITEWILTLK